MGQGKCSPPLPRLAFRVGVTGDRVLAAERVADLREQVGRLLAHVLATVRQIGVEHPAAYIEPDRPTLVVVASLAGDVDKLVADQAVRLGYRLDAPMPYDVARHDPEIADPNSPARRLYDGARARLILDGIQGDPNAGVEAGRRVVWNSDLVIAISDGPEAAGSGDTAEIVELARRLEVAVVHVHAEGTVELPEVTRLLRIALEPPREPPRAVEHRAPDLRESYFAERIPGPTARALLGKPYAILMGPMTWPGNISPEPLAHDYITVTTDEWRADWQAAGLPADLTRQLEEKLIPHYAWANQLAILYATRYRSVLLWISALAFVAILAAVLAHLSPRAGLVIVCNLVEVGALLAVVSLSLRASWGRYHRKWVDYRALAEQIRHLSFLLPLGLTSPATRPPAAARPADPNYTWLNWLLRAIGREVGLFRAAVDHVYLDHCRVLLDAGLSTAEDPRHQEAAARSHRLHARLNLMAGLVFALALATVGAQTFGVQWTQSRNLAFALAVLLPALGAAVHGFLSQGAYESLALQAEATRKRVARLRFEIAGLKLWSPSERERWARSDRERRLAALHGVALRSVAVLPLVERLSGKAEPCLRDIVPDLTERVRRWRVEVERLSDQELRALLGRYPLRHFPPAASAELSRCALVAAEILRGGERGTAGL
jgi:hypothetical protein